MDWGDKMFELTIGKLKPSGAREMAFYSNMRDRRVIIIYDEVNGKGDQLYIRYGDRHNVGTDFKSVLRHEYGHHVYYQFLSPEERVLWDRLFEEYSSEGINTFVSQYASKNPEEFFAECFSAYTSPLYGQTISWGNKWLTQEFPDDIVRLLEKLIGKRK
jgi:hypothetical protein